MAMGTRRRRQRQEELWYRRDLAEAPGHPYLPAAERGIGARRVRRVLRSSLPQVLSREAGPPVARAGDVLPCDADRVL